MKRQTTTIRSIAVVATILTGLFAALFFRSVIPGTPGRRRANSPRRGTRR